MSSLLLRCLRREPSAGEIVPQIKSEARLQWRGLTTQCETEATLINDNPAAWSEPPPPNRLRERVTTHQHYKTVCFKPKKVESGEIM